MDFIDSTKILELDIDNIDNNDIIRMIADELLRNPDGDIASVIIYWYNWAYAQLSGQTEFNIFRVDTLNSTSEELVELFSNTSNPETRAATIEHFSTELAQLPLLLANNWIDEFESELRQKVQEKRNNS